MPEYILGGLIAAVIAAAGGTLGLVNRLDRRIDGLEVKMAEEYVTKDDLDRLEDKVTRIDDKMDLMMVSISSIIALHEGHVIGPVSNNNNRKPYQF